MSSQSISRRLLLGGLALTTLHGPAHAQAVPDASPPPMVVYDDALSPGWSSQSWAIVDMSVYGGPVKPMRVRGGPRTALALERMPFSTKGYSKLTFYINGGDDGGQSIAVKALIDGKPAPSNYVVTPQARIWARIEVPLSQIGAADTIIDGLWFQGLDAPYKPYLITKIVFE